MVKCITYEKPVSYP